MRKEDRIREEVARAYGRAAGGPAAGNCCGGAAPAASGSCCAGPDPKGVAARLAGYREEVAGLPADAVEHSFGCGNPLAFSEVREGDVILDLGSGAGLDLLIAARKVGPRGRVIGVDMTDEMIGKARANLAAGGVTNAEVRKGLIEELPVESSSVDWVISNCVINLSPEKPRVFAEIARVLKPGGRMIVSDIVADGLPEWVLRIPELRCACVTGAISEREYVAGLRAAGLEEVEVRARLPFEEAQLRELTASDLDCADPRVASWLESHGEEALGRIAEELAGKVASVSFYARKPAR